MLRLILTLPLLASATACSERARGIQGTWRLSDESTLRLVKESAESAFSTMVVASLAYARLEIDGKRAALRAEAGTIEFVVTESSAFHYRLAAADSSERPQLLECACVVPTEGACGVLRVLSVDGVVVSDAEGAMSIDLVRASPL